MKGHASRRARRRRSRSWIIAIASSVLLQNMLRSVPIFVIVFGMLLTGFGLFTEVSAFSGDYTTLVNVAGGEDALVSNTFEVLRTQVLQAVGLAGPAPPAEKILVPATGALQATPTPGPGAGFVPYQIEVSGPTPGVPLAQNALEEHQAPPLPRLPRSTPTGAAPAAPGPAGPTSTSAAPAVPGLAGLSPTSAAPAAPNPAPPGWIVIPRINLDAPIVVSHTALVEVGGKVFAQWEAPDVYAAGWQEGSVPLGQPGNTVLNGHHNIYGGVFGRLHELQPYDEIIVSSGEREFHYLVSQVMKIEERNAPLEQRQENARWIMHSSDERLTLVTCWPPTSNTYRLIVVAVPVK